MNTRRLAPAAVLLLALAAVGVWLRGGAARDAGAGAPGPRASLRSTGAPEWRSRKVLFVGLDGADWEFLDGLVAAGSMPNLAKLLGEGRSGVLRTIHPPLSPLVWTTMMTGVAPLDHGILDFTRFRPSDGEREPISSSERRVPAIWNMAGGEGRSVAVFGLWATWPAETVNGLIVSDRLFSFQFGESVPPPGVVFPPGRMDWALSARSRAEAGIGLHALQEFLPWLGETEYRSLTARPDPYAHPVTALRRVLVETKVYHELATDWLREERPGLAIVYFQGTDAIGHLFAPYLPPRQEGIGEEDFVRYRTVATRYFGLIDRLLGEYRAIAAEQGSVLLIASDHGFRWTEDRPRAVTSFLAATAGKWHRDEGIYLLWGQGITPRAHGSARGREGVAAPAADGDAAAGAGRICATLLALLGLPPGKGLIGPPLPGVAPSPDPPIDYRTRFRPGGSSAMTADRGAASASWREREMAAEDLEKLRALGYVGKAEIASAPPIANGSTRTPGSWNNEGLILREMGKDEEARAAYEHAIALEPEGASALWNLSDLLFSKGVEPERSDRLLLDAFRFGLPDGSKAVVGRAIASARSGGAGRSLALLDGAVAIRSDDAELRLFRGRYRMQMGDCHGALVDFSEARRRAPGSAEACTASGLARLCMGDEAGARRDFAASLALDPNQPEIRRALDPTR